MAIQIHRLTVEADMERAGYRFRCPVHGQIKPAPEVVEAFTQMNDRSTPFLKHFIPSCPKCQELAQAEKDEEARIAMIGKNKKAARMPRRFQTCTLETWKIGTVEIKRQALIRAERYVGNFATAKENGICQVFSGPPGTGKTHLACAIINGVIEKGFTARYVTALDMKDAIQATYSDESKSKHEAFQEFLRPNLLVLDEVDLAHKSEDAQLILWRILSERYNDGQSPVILISNLNKEMLTERIGDRILDRLAENKGQFVSFSWESVRRAAT